MLLLTGLTGFGTARCPILNMPATAALLGTLFLTISGSTVLNMVFDRDIDCRMKRTVRRPLPAGLLNVKEAVWFGGLLSVAGLVGSFCLDMLFGIVVWSGWFLDVVVYTFWLKRRTPWSILWGGLSGGMPVLAGRVLGTGQLDSIGVLLAVAVVLWIPTHIMTFNLRHLDDYQKACVPTFPSRYGIRITRISIALSSMGTAFAFVLGAVAIGLAWGYLQVLAVMTAGILILAYVCLVKPSERKNLMLFRLASLYMLSAMLLILVGSGRLYMIN